MHPSEHKKLTHYSPLVVMSVFGLMIGLYIAIIGSQTSQENRSRAAIVNGTYNGTLNSNSNIINGGVTGDVIGSSNTISGNVAGCVKGNSNIIGGRVSGTVTGTGNIVALGSGGGPCLSATPTLAPTAVPTSAPTSVPTVAKTPTPSATKTPTPTPTKTPTPTQGVTPGLTLVPTTVPTATKVPTPTTFLTTFPTLTATPTPVQITATIGPTATPEPNSTLVAVTLFFHGVGKGGDSVNPDAEGNMSPAHSNRVISVDVYNDNNQLVGSKQGTVIFNASEGNFKGTISLGTTITTGAHTLRIKGEQYLRGIVPGIQMLTAGQTKTLPALTLITGDVNNDNQINIVDYNLLVGCYSDLLPPVSCNAGDNVRTDLNDDGNVNQFDYNLFIRELTNLGGQ